MTFGQVIPEKTRPAYLNSELPVSERVDDLHARMKLEENFRQMNLVKIGNLLKDGKLSPEKLEDYFGRNMIGTLKNLANVDYLLTLTTDGIAEFAHEIQKYATENTPLGIPIPAAEVSLYVFMALGIEKPMYHEHMNRFWRQYQIRVFLG